MKKITFILLFIIVVAFSSCTKNQRTRLVGGYQRIDLPVNQKLVLATWKNNNLWILTEEMDDTYEPKMKKFQEHSSFGWLEGEIVFYEHKN